MRKDFKNLDIYAAFQPANGAEWQKANGIHADWKTPEHIEVKPVYTKEDPVSYTHLRAHETGRNLVCRLLLEKKKKQKINE